MFLRFLRKQMGNNLEFPSAIQGRDKLQLATFGQGCFWGTDHSFRKKFLGKGLIDCQVGYSGGTVENPTYQAVCTGKTGHAEVVHLLFDPNQVSFSELVDFFYRSHDPLTLNRQGNDAGTQYRSVIFYHNQEQQKLAEQGTAIAQSHFGQEKIQTTLEKFTAFYPAEIYHQEYLFKNPNGYQCATHFERTWERIESIYKRNKM